MCSNCMELKTLLMLYNIRFYFTIQTIILILQTKNTMKQFIPKDGQMYYAPTFISNYKSLIIKNTGSEFDQEMIDRGLTFESEELANRFYDVAMNAIIEELAKEEVAVYLNGIETYGIGTFEERISYFEGLEAIDSYNLKIEGVLERKVSDMDSRPTISTFIGNWWVENEEGNRIGKIHSGIDYELIN